MLKAKWLPELNSKQGYCNILASFRHSASLFIFFIIDWTSANLKCFTAAGEEREERAGQ